MAKELTERKKIDGKVCEIHTGALKVEEKDIDAWLNRICDSDLGKGMEEDFNRYDLDCFLDSKEKKHTRLKRRIVALRYLEGFMGPCDLINEARAKVGTELADTLMRM